MLAFGQLILGVITFFRPNQTVRTLTSGRGGVPDERIVRVLGARQALQGAVLIIRPRREIVKLAAAADALHAASLIPVIAASHRYRRAAVISAALASTAAATAGVLARPKRVLHQDAY